MELRVSRRFRAPVPLPSPSRPASTTATPADPTSVRQHDVRLAATRRCRRDGRRWFDTPPSRAGIRELRQQRTKLRHRPAFRSQPQPLKPIRFGPTGTARVRAERPRAQPVNFDCPEAFFGRRPSAGSSRQSRSFQLAVRGILITFRCSKANRVSPRDVEPPFAIVATSIPVVAVWCAHLVPDRPST